MCTFWRGALQCSVFYPERDQLIFYVSFNTFFLHLNIRISCLKKNCPISEIFNVLTTCTTTTTNIIGCRFCFDYIVRERLCSIYFDLNSKTVKQYSVTNIETVSLKSLSSCPRFNAQRKKVVQLERHCNKCFVPSSLAVYIVTILYCRRREWEISFS